MADCIGSSRQLVAVDFFFVTNQDDQLGDHFQYIESALQYYRSQRHHQGLKHTRAMEKSGSQ
jgi:hypothetical protein